MNNMPQVLVSDLSGHAAIKFTFQLEHSSFYLFIIIPHFFLYFCLGTGINHYCGAVCNILTRLLNNFHNIMI